MLGTKPTKCYGALNELFFRKKVMQKGSLSRAVEKGCTCLGRIWGDFSNAFKIEFLCRKVTFGHVGIVQKAKKAKKSARLFFIR